MLNLDTVLEHACGNPEDFSQWEAEGMNGNPLRKYTGWMVYELETHCVGFRIVAKPNGDGTFTVRDHTMYDC